MVVAVVGIASQGLGKHDVIRIEEHDGRLGVQCVLAGAPNKTQVTTVFVWW